MIHMPGKEQPALSNMATNLLKPIRVWITRKYALDATLNPIVY